MRNQWYGDHRDIVKWGVLLRLAREYQLSLIIQVAYLTPDNGVPSIVSEELGEEQVAPEVLRHFRNIHHIAGLAEWAGVQIEVFDLPFAVQSRDEYTQAVVIRTKALDGTSSAVFLDPDTGLSKNRKSAAHVTPEEVSAVWAALPPRGWLILYQHASRETNWVENRREAFEAACPGSRVSHQFCSRNGARDVAFFAASHNYGPA